MLGAARIWHDGRGLAPERNAGLSAIARGIVGETEYSLLVATLFSQKGGVCSEGRHLLHKLIV